MGPTSQAQAPRIFTGLAVGNMFVLLAAAVLGFIKPQTGAGHHVLLAVFALLLSCLIHVGLFTYLSVVGKLIAQALHLGGFELAPLDAIRACKRTIVRVLLAVALSIVAATATGAARAGDGGVSVLHLSAAVLLLGLHALAFVRGYAIVVEASGLLERTLNAYTERKAEKRSERRTG